MEILLEKDSHRLFARLVLILSNRLFEEQGNAKDILDLSEKIIEFGNRLSSLRLTAKQLNDYEKLDALKLQPTKVIDYFKKIDEEN